MTAVLRDEQVKLLLDLAREGALTPKQLMSALEIVYGHREQSPFVPAMLDALDAGDITLDTFKAAVTDAASKQPTDPDSTIYVITVEMPQEDPYTVVINTTGTAVEAYEESTYLFSKWSDGEGESTIDALNSHLESARTHPHPQVREWYKNFASEQVTYNRSDVDEFDVDWDALTLRKCRMGDQWYDAEGNEIEAPATEVEVDG